MMIRNATLLAALILWCSLASSAELPSAAPAEPVTIIHAGTLIAVPGEVPKRVQSIIVRGARIEEIVAGFIVRPDAKIIDLSQLTVLPGLIDVNFWLSKML